MSDSSSSISTASNLPGVIDLFSGCGGLALGFQQAGFDILYGADIQQEACDTANYNLCWKLGHEANHFCTDLTTLDASEILPYTNGRNVIVIGGPPCQAYSTAGRAKLRSLGEDRIHLNDKRGYLFEDFIRLALDLDASAIVMGNIKSKSVQINNGAVIEGMCSQCYADVSPTSFFEVFKDGKK